MDFMAIDFETANVNQSPCSLGLTIIRNNKIEDCFSYLINPNEPFSYGNIKVNGIRPSDVVNSPQFLDVWNEISDLFIQYPLVAHNATFDRYVLVSALKKYNIAVPKMKFYCTMRMAQQNFPEINKYGLSELCEYFSVDLSNHHCCDADSLACASLLLKMMEFPNFELYPLNDIDISFLHSSSFYDSEPIFEEPHVIYDNPLDFTFLNRLFVITGSIGNYDRDTLFKIIENFGGICRKGISKKTDYLIVGKEDKSVVKDKLNIKSEKILKAEQLKSSGSKIKIVSEDQFLKALGGNA